MEKDLTREQAEEKLKLVGPNEITVEKRFTALSLFFSQFPTFINGILAAAAIFSFFIQDALDGFLILAILLLNALFGFIQEYRAEKSLEKLKSFVKPTSRVIRNGREQEVPTSSLVPQDIVVLSEGDRIPADGILLSSAHMEIDEAILTGESLPITKKKNDRALNGTLVVKGKGIMKVEKTGMQTRFGQIAQTLSSIETDKTPLQKNLEVLGKMLSLGALVIALSLIPIGMAQGKSLLPLILLSVSIAIAAIPEGLPAVITVALAIGTNRMAKKNAIIRKMPAIETLGSVQVILTDKTGTLTQNVMRVKKYHLRDNAHLPLLLRACVVSNTASLVRKQDGGTDEFDVIGDRTDGALLLFAQSLEKNIEAIKGASRIIEEYPFDPETKTVSVVVEQNGIKHVFVRGAPEEVIKRSTVSLHEKREIETLFEEYAKMGFRVVGFGTRTILQHRKGTHRAFLENNLTFLGLIGIHDPPRAETKRTIQEAKMAGIQIVMVTGDNELTALAIAKEVGLIQKDEDVINGDELAALSDEELKKILPKTRIFARSKPEDKLRLVNLFKELGYVVGVTGDGVNDTLALKRADVGIAMGQTGTDVAKEASDIILIDDNFTSLIKAIKEGRTIYHNISKSIVYLLSGNLAELSLVFFGTLLGLPSPLLPTQILWINVVTDGLPALALASDTQDIDLLKEKPRDPKTPILTMRRLSLIGIIGFGLSFLLLFVFIAFLPKGEVFARTITFNLLVFLHVAIVFVVRGGSFKKMSPFFIFAVITTYVAQILITLTPGLQKIFHLGF
ncbi:MAG: hypothetical protein A3J69_02785 [Candidatus Levybacteria bacterium RIFCSPHIGHO2_02_FULL_42_12]|nr:MAG: hypothetical protein A3J69_02785 [Candidatus Levybacteria bacterium RIFCSPHIGHO2_02_FULL_42_12]OGH43003.1 MAG: hypothetical protein A3B53_02105 [Candidatus Levybacteria bacterium RIFCSPLOWO2_01_FULL_42_15]